MADTETTEVMNLDDYVLLPEELVQELANAIKKATKSEDKIKFSELANKLSDTTYISSTLSYSVEDGVSVVTIPDRLLAGLVTVPSSITSYRIEAPNLESSISSGNWFTNMLHFGKGFRIDLYSLKYVFPYDFYKYTGSVFLHMDTIPTAFWTLSDCFNNVAGIYVPDDMVNKYKATTNYTVVADKIKGMSEYGV